MVHTMIDARRTRSWPIVGPFCAQSLAWRLIVWVVTKIQCIGIFQSSLMPDFSKIAPAFVNVSSCPDHPCVYQVVGQKSHVLPRSPIAIRSPSTSVASPILRSFPRYPRTGAGPDQKSTGTSASTSSNLTDRHRDHPLATIAPAWLCC